MLSRMVSLQPWRPLVRVYRSPGWGSWGSTPSAKPVRITAITMKQRYGLMAREEVSSITVRFRPEQSDITITGQLLTHGAQIESAVAQRGSLSFTGGFSVGDTYTIVIGGPGKQELARCEIRLAIDKVRIESKPDWPSPPSNLVATVSGERALLTWDRNSSDAFDFCSCTGSRNGLHHARVIRLERPRISVDADRPVRHFWQVRGVNLGHGGQERVGDWIEGEMFTGVDIASLGGDKEKRPTGPRVTVNPFAKERPPAPGRQRKVARHQRGGGRKRDSAKKAAKQARKDAVAAFAKGSGWCIFPPRVTGVARVNAGARAVSELVGDGGMTAAIAREVILQGMGRFKLDAKERAKVDKTLAELGLGK